MFGVSHARTGKVGVVLQVISPLHQDSCQRASRMSFSNGVSSCRGLRSVSVFRHVSSSEVSLVRCTTQRQRASVFVQRSSRSEEFRRVGQIQQQ